MFTADSRNLGGRNLIFSEIFNHRSHLSYINTYPIGLGFQKSGIMIIDINSFSQTSCQEFERFTDTHPNE